MIKIRNRFFEGGVVILLVLLLVSMVFDNKESNEIKEISLTKTESPYIIASDRSNHIAVKYHLKKSIEKYRGGLVGFEVVKDYYDVLKKTNTLVLLYPNIEELSIKYQNEFFPVSERYITPKDGELARAYFKLDDGKYRGIIASFSDEGFEKAIIYLLDKEKIKTNTLIIIKK